MAWNPKTDPVVGGMDPALGVYTTRSGRNVTRAEYEKATGKKAPKVADLGPKNPVDRNDANNKALYGLPGVPRRFTSRAQVITFLKNSPAYAKKQRGWLNAHHKALFNEAGYAIDPKTQQITKYVAPPTAAERAAAAAKAAKTGSAPTGASSPSGGTRASGGGTGAGSSDTESNNSGLFDQIAGLDPNTGTPMTRGMIDAIVNGTYNPQMSEVRREIGRNPAQLKTNLADIARWYGDSIKGVEQAKTRGADMTKSVADATTGNAKSILESIGGAAALGAQGVAQSGANAAGTIQALGAVDQSFLNDIQPLLQGEAANASTSETARMGNLLQGYKQRLSDLAVQKGGARATGVSEALKYNSDLGQQAFTNKVGLIQTAGALALDNAKAQNYLADQQAKADKATATGNKTILATIQKANSQANQYGYDPAELYAQYPKGGLAPGELVSNVLNTYRANSLPLTDPRVRSAAAALIQTYGYKVDPKWVNGWR
jgi:hypothetical protein